MYFFSLITLIYTHVINSYNQWKDQTSYTIGDIIEYQNELYICKLSHTSVINWYPSIYTQVLWEKLNENEIPKVERIEKVERVERPRRIEKVEQVKQEQHTKQTTIATYYFRVGSDVEGCPAVQSFNDGNSYGPCNNGQGVKYTSESKYWVAIRNAREHCGKTITAKYGDNSMNLLVMDSCPGCEIDNHVDMSLEALIELTGSKEHACSIGRTLPMITWHFN
jgi:hypothetical protein